jgi:hypothetical protein
MDNPTNDTTPAPLELTFLGTESAGGHCPSLFATNRGTLVVQGKTVTDPAALATVANTYAGLGEDETVVEIPIDLLRHATTA